MATTRGKITGVEQNVETGWFTILTDSGEAKKMQTKMEQKAREAAVFAKSGELLDIDYSAKDSSNTNPHTGQPYRNIYYERAVPVSSNGGSADVDDGIVRTQTPSRPTDKGDAWRIALSVGAKLAVETVNGAGLSDSSFPGQAQVALAWANFVYSTPPPSETAPQSSHGAYSEPPPPHGDEDIPFMATLGPFGL
jgi:hypothetical protein